MSAEKNENSHGFMIIFPVSYIQTTWHAEIYMPIAPFTKLAVEILTVYVVTVNNGGMVWCWHSVSVPLSH